jgi:AcrR family transcriptional regulator
VARTGRRPGQTQTREDILAAARNQFGERGYAGATIRGIAAEAGVNPALVHHFFGTKEQVFIAALNIPINPEVLVETILDGPHEQIGERIVRLFLGLVNDPDIRQMFLALIRSVAGSPQIADLVRQFFEAVILTRVAGALGLPPLRLAGAAAQMMGLALLRHVVGAQPVLDATDEEMVALVAPVIQHYFTV